MSMADGTTSIFARTTPRRAENGDGGDSLPPRAREKLLSFARRRRRFALLSAAMLAFAVGLALLLAVCLIDRLWPLSGVIRLVFLIANIVLVTAIAIRPLRQLLASRRRRLLRDALHLEALVPPLREQLITLASHDRKHSAPSPALVRELGREVDRALDLVNVTALIPARALRASLIPAASAALLALVLACWPWLDLRSLAARYILPLSDRPAVTTTRFTVEPGNSRLIVGQPLNIVVHAQHLGEGGVKLHIAGSERSDGSIETTVMMTPVTGEAGSFVYSIPSVQRDLSYVVSGGDARSPRYIVRALRPPGVLELRGTIHSPSYVHEGPQSFSSIDGKLDALRGSSIDLSIVACEPLRSAQIVLGGDRRIETQPTDQPNVRRATLAVDRNTTMRFELISHDGISGAGPPDARLRALTDRAPAARWDLLPSTELHVRPRDRLALAYEASDDVALASLAATVSVNGTQALALPLQLAPGARSADGTLQLPLARLDVEIGDALELRLEAVDGAGQVTRSGACRVFISPAADDLESRQRLAALGDAADAADEMVALCERARAAIGEQQDSEGRGNDAAVPYTTAAAESAGRSIESMLRAIARTDDPGVAMALSRMIDTVQQRQSRLEGRGSNPAAVVDVDDARATAREISAAARVLWQGDRAAQALAELEDAQAWEGSTTTTRPFAAATTQPTTQQTNRRMINQLRRDARKAATDLGIELPTTGPVGTLLNQKLRQRVEQVRAFAASQSQVDFDQASRAWVENAEARIGFSRRLLVGSRAEALSRRGDAAWARDLHLASRAAQRIDDTLAKTRPDLRGAFAVAMAALKADHDLNLAPVKATGTQSSRIRSTAEDARRQMRSWADPSPATSPATRSSEMAALEANAATAAAAAAVRASSRVPSPSTITSSGDPPAMGADVSQPVQHARALNELEQRQRQLRSQTTRRTLTTRPALADAQAALADDVARQARQSDGSRSEKALQALREARRRLAQIESAIQPGPATASTTAPSTEAAKDAAKLAEELRQSVPEAQAASRVVEKQLVPSLAAIQLEKNSAQPASGPSTGAPSGGGTGGGASGATAESRAQQAIQQTRRALTQAEQSVAAEAPLAAAALAARDAQLAMNQNDAAADRAAHVAQDKAAALLAEARRQALAEAARDRLQEVPAFAAILRPAGGASNNAAVPGVAHDGAARANVLPREWGRLRERSGGDMNAPGAQPDPPEFQEALRAYFKALNQPRTWDLRR